MDELLLIVGWGLERAFAVPGAALLHAGVARVCVAQEDLMERRTRRPSNPIVGSREAIRR